jgi:hypothetical protein
MQNPVNLTFTGFFVSVAIQKIPFSPQSLIIPVLECKGFFVLLKSDLHVFEPSGRAVKHSFS